MCSGHRMSATRNPPVLLKSLLGAGRTSPCSRACLIFLRAQRLKSETNCAASLSMVSWTVYAVFARTRGGTVRVDLGSPRSPDLRKYFHSSQSDRVGCGLAAQRTRASMHSPSVLPSVSDSYARVYKHLCNGRSTSLLASRLLTFCSLFCPLVLFVL